MILMFPLAAKLFYSPPPPLEYKRCLGTMTSEGAKTRTSLREAKLWKCNRHGNSFLIWLTGLCDPLLPISPRYQPIFHSPVGDASTSLTGWKLDSEAILQKYSPHTRYIHQLVYKPPFSKRRGLLKRLYKTKILPPFDWIFSNEFFYFW